MAIRADRVGVRQDQVDVHGRVTSPSFLNELLENLPEWTDMPVWVNGTEEVLPSNNSVPVTSPILADIVYPDIRRDNQYFTYRESPTPVDGLAKIKSIKGNTLVWNQMATLYGSTATVNGITFTKGDTGYTINGTNTGSISQKKVVNRMPMTLNHKYLIMGCPKNGSQQTYRISLWFNNDVTATPKNDYGNGSIINYDTSYTNNNLSLYIDVYPNVAVNNLLFVPQCFDLTAMFGSGNEPSTVEEFTSLFPLPYYAYNQGTLLSFNGNGIKTVGKNQFDTQVVTTSYQGLTLTKTQGTIRAVYSGGSQYAGFNFYGSPVFTDTFLKGRYRLSFDVSGLDTQWTVGLRQGATFIGGQALAISNDGHYSFNIDAEANPNCYLSFARTGNKTTAFDVTFSNIQLELGITESEYQPYETNTTELPISTYFPTGMKSAGTAYDELTPRKAITRIGAIDLGTLTWSSGTTAISGKNRWVATVNGIKLAEAQSSTGNILNSKYNTFTWNNSFNANVGDGIAVSSTAERIAIYDESLATETAETVASSLSGVYLYYEMATPVELPTMSFE